MKRVWISVLGIALVTGALIYVLPVGAFGAGILIAIAAFRITKRFWG